MIRQKKCRRCKHYLPKNYKKAFCLSCKRKINKAKREEKPKIIKVYKHTYLQKIVKVAEVCDTCCKPGILAKVKRYHHVTGKPFAESIACEKCRDGFLKRLGYR